MPDYIWKNATVSKVLSKKFAISITLLMLSFILLSCGGSGGDGDGETSGTVNFPPVVFMADKDNDGTAELYASFDNGTDIIKLSETLISGGNIVGFKVSPDGVFVAYVADQDSNDLFELYVVPVDKTPNDSAVKVSVPLAGSGLRETAPGSGEYFFAWGPDSSRVAYIADAADPVVEIVDLLELFSSTPDGIEKDLVSDLVDPNSDVKDFQWEPSSTLISYVADQDVDNVIELYVSPSNSNLGNVRVSGPMAGNGIKENPSGSGKYSFAWAPDSSRLAYIADQNVLDKFELFTSTPDGISNLQISGPFNDTRDVEDFKWAPDSLRIAYTANQDTAAAIDLFSAPPNITTTSQQNSSGLASGQAVSIFKWAPDSSRIAFISDKIITDFFRLYSVQPVNNNDILISGGLSSTNDVIEFEWAPDSSQIAYLVEDQNLELFTTLPARSSSTQITKPLVLGRDVFEFEWAPNSSRIAYTADFDAASVIELFSSSPDNSITDKVSGSLATNGDVGEFKWAPDSSGVGYIADQEANDVDELYASRPNGDDNTKLSGDLVSGGDVDRFEWVP